MKTLVYFLFEKEASVLYLERVTTNSRAGSCYIQLQHAHWLAKDNHALPIKNKGLNSQVFTFRK